MGFCGRVLRLSFGVEDRCRPFAERGVNGVSHAIRNGHHRSWQTVQAGRQVVFCLQRVGEKMVVLAAVVGCDLGTRVFENERSTFLEQLDRSVGLCECMVLPAGEHPKSVVGDASAHFHVGTKR